MYTPPVEATTVQPASFAPSEKSGDNGFSDLLRDRHESDRAEARRTEDLARRDREPREAQREETRPDNPRNDTPKESRDVRQDADTRDTASSDTSDASDARRTDKTSADEASTATDEIPAKPEETAGSALEDMEEITEPTATSPSEVPATAEVIDTTTPDDATQTGGNKDPGPQVVLETATTPAVDTQLDPADASETGAKDAIVSETTAAVDSSASPPSPSTESAQTGAAAPVVSVSRPDTTQQTLPSPAVAPSQDTSAAAAGANTATAAETSAQSPLAAAASKATVGTQNGSGTSRTTPNNSPDGNVVSATPSPTDTGETFETALTTGQNAQAAQPGPSPSGPLAANAPANGGNTDAGLALSKAAEDIMPRSADTLPQTAAPSTTQSATPAAAFGSELRFVSDATPLSETAAARNTPNAAANQLAVQINRAVVDGQEKIVVNLKPGTLGRVAVNLEVGHDNRIIAVISVEKADTLDLLQRDVRTLERALQEAGLKTDSGSLSFNLQGQGAGDSPFDDFSNDGPFAALPLSGEDADGTATSSTTTAYAMTKSGVDIHV